MRTDFDVIVCGGGIAGIAAALAAGGEDNVTAVLAQTEDEDVASVWEALAEVCTEDITVTYNAHPFHPKTEEDDA